MFSLPTFQSKGFNQTLFYLKNIQKDVTVNSHPDRSLQNVVFGMVYLENQDNSALVKILPHVVNQDCKSDVKEIFHDV